jgi:hypothetical protein
VDPARNLCEPSRWHHAADRSASPPRCSVNAAMPLDRLGEALRDGGYHSASE